VVEGGKKKFAIEIEGADFHAPGRIAKEKHEDDTIRQGDLTRAGYIVERIAAQQIFDESRVLTGGLKDRLRDLLFQDEPLKASLAEGGEGSDVAEGDKPALEAGLLHLYHIPKYFRPLQLALFYRLVSDRERLRDEPVVLFDKAPVGPLLPIALHELLTLVHQTETPYGIELGLPRQYRVLLAKPLGANCRDVWAEYLRTCEEGLDAAIPYGVRLADCQAEELELSVGETVIEVNLSSSFRGEIGETAESCERISILAKSISPEEQLRYRESLCIPQNALRPLNWHKRTVDYFVRRFFSIPALHRWQWEILTKTVKGEDVFGIMPTGSGKSLCYQLPAMILPGNVLVISPLRSLMRDQIANLRDYGFNRADYIASDIPSAQKDQNLEDFLKGALQLLYISPERVQIKSFLEDICERAKYLNISCVAVDEAHCVSEWGHDFRPSYLRIPRFVKEVLRAGDRRPPILAITATASPPVERDVRTILGIISDDQLIKAKSIDRSNLSFSVHCVDEDAEKLDVLRQVLTKEVPKALKIGFEKLIAQGEDYEHSGVVFAIYASPEGKSTYRDGIGAIFDHLTGDETVPRNLCRLHSSGVPKRCPNCHHFTFHHVTGGSTEQESKKYRCEICRAEFESPEKPNEREWEQEVKKNQEDFKHSRFPVLIATKGYGMGVDKRNIRYIIHHGFSSSLEAYYQEAGRAGRDDEHSHCAIVSSPPHTNCELDYFGRHDASVVSQKYAHIIF
jgi:ATP-dependent DNA helicase RecQ